MPNLENKFPPPIIALACAIGIYSLARLLPATLVAMPFGLRLSASLALMGLGLLLDLWAVLYFRRARTTVNPLRPERATALVTGGPFAISRNPMYVGMALVLLGLTVWFAQPLGLVFVAAFVAILTRLQIVPEERALGAHFSTDFEAYRARVPRWLLV